MARRLRYLHAIDESPCDRPLRPREVTTGLSWWEISVRLGVPRDAWFVEVRRDPGPPYGKAHHKTANSKAGGSNPGKSGKDKKQGKGH